MIDHWNSLQDVGDSIVVRARREIAERVSASRWGQRFGGKIRVQRIGRRLMECTLVERGVRVSKRKRTEYSRLHALDVGQSMILPFDRGRTVREWTRCYMAVNRASLNGKRFKTRLGSQGLFVRRIS